MNKPVQHISNLSPLRGIAALWVLFFHLDVIIFYRDLGPLISHESTGLLQKGYLWVDFFFMLSGFIITHVYRTELQSAPWKESIPKYLWSRFTRLYPLHIFTLLVVIVIAKPVEILLPQVVDGSWKTYFDWEAIPSNLLFTHAMNQHSYLSWNIASWSIGAEWWTYVLAIPVLMFLPARKYSIYVVLALVCYFLLAQLMMRYGNGKLDITFNYGFVRCLLEFLIGVCVYQGFLKCGASSRLHRLFSLDFVFILVFILIVVGFHFQCNDLLFIPLFSLLILAAAVNQSRIYEFLQGNWLQYLGKISYSIYLVHSVWFLVYWNVFPHLQLSLENGMLPTSIRLIFVLTFFAFTLFCSHYSYLYVELSARRFLRERFFVRNFS